MSIEPVGYRPAKIMVIGDTPGADDQLKRRMWQGTAGAEMRKMLHEAGISQSECYMTNVFKTRVPDMEALFDFKNKRPIGDTLEKQRALLDLEIEECSPAIIIALGGIPLWMLHGDSAISTWRGSLLSYKGIKVIPTYHPTQIMRVWEWRSIALTDLRRAKQEALTPGDFGWRDYQFIVRPGFEQTLNTLRDLLQEAEKGPLKLSVDIETRSQFMACIGIAWSQTAAICIPLMCVENHEGYWNEREELEIITTIRDLLTHRNVAVVGQNFLYDAQYFAKEHGYVPRVTDDTMFMQHVLFPGLPKGLDFLASMYCQKYVYWKGEGKDWDPSTPEEQLWTYNCKDACYTYEISDVLPPSLVQQGLSEQYAFQMRVWYNAFRMMLRGVRIDLQYRTQLTGDLLNDIMSREQRVLDLCGHPLNPRSPKQMQSFFYQDLKLPVQRSRKGLRGITTDDDALTKLASLEPIVAPLCNTIREMRSLGVFLSTFVRAPLDHDKRIRCSFNPAGTESFRLSSSKDAFGSGTNLQNIPKGDEEEDHDANKLVLPNIRKLFLPDHGKIIFDVDLSGADAQVVAWEADDDILKAIFRSGQKVHAVNAKDIFGGDAGPDGKKEPYYSRAKLGCHLTNYGGKPRTLSLGLGLTIHEAERFQRRWFEIHPGIAEWHRRVEAQLQSTREVRNMFGYRRFYFDRLDDLLPEALAWIPQSTVAIVTNRQWDAIERNIREVDLLIQVHDSLVGQCDADDWQRVKPLLRDNLHVVVPYADPLVIPSGLKTSRISWGRVETESWE
jgi:uracil-DNA glycosylase family 4